MVDAVLAKAENYPEMDIEFEVLLERLIEMCEKRKLFAEFNLVQEELKSRKRAMPVVPIHRPLLLGNDAA